MKENWWTLLKIHFSSWSNLNDSFREEKEFCQSRKSSIWMKIFGRKSKYLKFLPIRLNFWTNWALRLSGMRVHITLLLQTALHMAIARLPSSVAVVRLLLSRGADWSIKSDDEEAGTAREQIKGIWAAFIQKQFLLSQGGPWGCSKALHPLWFITATVKLVYSWPAANLPKKTSVASKASVSFLVSYRPFKKFRPTDSVWKPALWWQRFVFWTPIFQCNVEGCLQ